MLLYRLTFLKLSRKFRFFFKPDISQTLNVDLNFPKTLFVQILNTSECQIWAPGYHFETFELSDSPSSPSFLVTSVGVPFYKRTLDWDLGDWINQLCLSQLHDQEQTLNFTNLQFYNISIHNTCPAHLSHRLKSTS